MADVPLTDIREAHSPPPPYRSGSLPSYHSPEPASPSPELAQGQAPRRVAPQEFSPPENHHGGAMHDGENERSALDRLRSVLFPLCLVVGCILFVILLPIAVYKWWLGL
ncbi:hypothetical protein B0O99DRAFT_597898 [Bisporella sp. PMI_857]|nr:hypothetical protein B0O99DRAFT_597898 [Bisporella sp. PMI_857]